VLGRARFNPVAEAKAMAHPGPAASGLPDVQIRDSGKFGEFSVKKSDFAVRYAKQPACAAFLLGARGLAGDHAS